MIKGKGFFEIGGNFGLEKYPPGDKIFNPLLEPYSDHQFKRAEIDGDLSSREYCPLSEKREYRDTDTQTWTETEREQTHEETVNKKITKIRLK